MKKGSLYLIPVPISDNLKITDILVQRDVDIVKKLNHFVTETPKTARAFLKDLPLTRKIQDIEIGQLNKRTKDMELESLLKAALEGKDMGLISDAGVPTIADPGHRLVKVAHRLGIRVIPLIGPSSIFLALMASGLNGQNFVFYGYLPKERGRKRKRIKTLERIADSTNQTQMFMEVPYKNQHMLDDILDVCEPGTLLCIAQDIMSKSEYIATKSIAQWKKEQKKLEKRPCLFLINSGD